MICNAEIRFALKEANIKHWQLAEMLNISEYTLCKRLRRELSENQKNEIMVLIETNK